MGSSEEDIKDVSVTDDDKVSDDTDFMADIGGLIHFEDLDAKHKGYDNINNVGKI